jgi:hypothetical protein
MFSLTSIHFTPYEFGLDLIGLLLFGIGSFVLISMLLFYYNRIPKSNQPKSEFQNPIYQSKDILLQQNSVNGNYLMAEKTSSTWVKAIICLFIAIIIFTPFYELIGVDYFV